MCELSQRIEHSYGGDGDEEGETKTKGNLTMPVVQAREVHNEALLEVVRIAKVSLTFTLTPTPSEP